MHETRRQRAAPHNENVHHAGRKAHFVNKDIPVHAQNNVIKSQLVPGNNRRALGEIGNLVGALSSRCIVSKDSLPKEEQHENLAQSVVAAELVAKAQRPITRKFGANIANNVPLPPPPPLEPQRSQNDAQTSWRSKQRRTMGQPSAATLSRLSNVAATAHQATESGAQLPTANHAEHRIPRGPANHGNVMIAWKKRQTLTATLTARSEAACGGFEVEMEEAEEPLPNIDAQDVGNQLAVVDYVEDIYSFYRKAEIQSCVSPEYMARQSDINEKMRAILIDWLIEVHLKFKLMPETLFLTVNLIDRFLESNPVVRKNLQLVGVTAMLLACKYEEIWAPEVRDFVKICDKAYMREQILEMEKVMLNKLKFNLTIPTPYVFLVRFLKAASSDTQLEMLAFFLTELCLTEYSTIKYCPSLLAAAAVYTAQQTLGRSPSWGTILQRHSGYTEMHLRDCAMRMVGFHKRAAVGNLTVVHKKYANAKFCSVAMLQPAVLSN